MDFQRSRVDLGLEALDRTLVNLWQLGGNALVAWRASAAGIEVLACPIGVLFARAEAHRRIFAGERLMGSRTFEKVASILGVAPVEIALPLPVGAGAATLPTLAIERRVARYTVVRTDYRGVFLIDIAGFSLLSPESQAAQLATLGYALNLAEARAIECSLPVDLARSTTGDGFYLWNRRKGLDADAALFALFALALATHARLQPTLSPNGAPAIRSAFGIGSHYTYHRRDGLGEASHDYIVGDVTIRLARLVERAERNQILVAEFARPTQNASDTIGPTAFLDKAAAAVAVLAGTEIAGVVIERIATYITGPRDDRGAFAVRRLAVLDKHGHRHHAYNAKINVILRNAPPLYLGKRDRDLEMADAAFPMAI